MENIMVFLSIVMLCLAIGIYIETKHKKSEDYSDVRIPDCAYGLGGDNIAYCNEWLERYKKGHEVCMSGENRISCKKALACCNRLATCGGGKDCTDPKYTPTINNDITYDKDYYTDS